VVTTSTTFYHAQVINVPCANQDHDHARRTNLALPALQGVTARQFSRCSDRHLQPSVVYSARISLQARTNYSVSNLSAERILLLRIVE